MAESPRVPMGNLLLACLPSEDLERILRCCERLNLKYGEILCEADRPFQYVYFPLTGFISRAAALEDHPSLEMGLIGNEGMLGATLSLGIDGAPMRAVVQGPGSMLRMTARQLRRELNRNGNLLRVLNRYIYVLMAQMSQSAACTYFHEIEPRLACWLLMTHDRAHADRFHFTHADLAHMLGVRRSGVTIAAGVLQQRGFIRYMRGEINILDRKGLEAAACKCYVALDQDYAQAFP